MSKKPKTKTKAKVNLDIALKNIVYFLQMFPQKDHAAVMKMARKMAQ
jgi:hypothetical protein